MEKVDEQWARSELEQLRELLHPDHRWRKSLLSAMKENEELKAKLSCEWWEKHRV